MIRRPLLQCGKLETVNQFDSKYAIGNEVYFFLIVTSCSQIGSNTNLSIKGSLKVFIENTEASTLSTRFISLMFDVGNSFQRMN